VTYVGNIRTYYDMLSFLTGGPDVVKIEAPAGEPEEKKPEDPLNINSPVL
jgi:membrane-bound lytic murein transglycosylase F